MLGCAGGIDGRNPDKPAFPGSPQPEEGRLELFLFVLHRKFYAPVRCAG
jgi:hypothetical protein